MEGLVVQGFLTNYSSLRPYFGPAEHPQPRVQKFRLNNPGSTQHLCLIFLCSPPQCFLCPGPRPGFVFLPVPAPQLYIPRYQPQLFPSSSSGSMEGSLTNDTLVSPSLALLFQLWSIESGCSRLSPAITWAETV